MVSQSSGVSWYRIRMDLSVIRYIIRQPLFSPRMDQRQLVGRGDACRRFPPECLPA